MRALLQRSARAQVWVQEQQIASIAQGLTVFLGIQPGDDEKTADFLLEKIINLRIFSDENQKMNLSLLDIQGELLLVSQFTLYGNTRKGRRPSFTKAEEPGKAERLFNYCVAAAKRFGLEVATGKFGADMQVHIINDGPVTLWLDTDILKSPAK